MAKKRGKTSHKKEHHVHHKLSPVPNAALIIILIIVGYAGIQYIIQDDLTLEATDVSLVGQAKGAAGKEKFVYGTVTDCNKIVKGVSGKDIFFRGTTRIVDPCKLSRKGQKKLNIDLACDVSDDNFKSHELKDKCKNKDEMKIYSCDGQERLISQIFKCPHGCNKDKNHCKKTKGLSLTEKSQRGQDMIIDMQSKTNVKATKSYGKSPAKMVRI